MGSLSADADATTRTDMLDVDAAHSERFRANAGELAGDMAAHTQAA